MCNLYKNIILAAVNMKWFALLSLFLLASLTFVEVDSEDIDEDDSDGDGVPDDEDDDDDNDGIPDDGKLCIDEGEQRFVFDLVLYFAFCNTGCFVLQRQINIFVHHLDDDDDDDDDILDVDEDDEDGDAEEDSGAVKLTCWPWQFYLKNSPSLTDFLSEDDDDDGDGVLDEDEDDGDDEL